MDLGKEGKLVLGQGYLDSAPATERSKTYAPAEEAVGHSSRGQSGGECQPVMLGPPTRSEQAKHRGAPTGLTSSPGLVTLLVTLEP